MKTSVDKELCIGCALCPSLAPELYTMDGGDKAVVLKQDALSDREITDAKEAADSCPVDAITVLD